ncbi:MAG: tRNA lysidine(34) synthetase TilS [Caulobacterales bacterium]|uniref:tRNA lysidine(34) synthetase TilS n=1 Tax=Glycocaulis sp. TaxID=1969725 RepID=UPI003F9FDB72
MPLDSEPEAWARAPERLCPSGPLVLALSGGGDSTALACILADISGRTSRPFKALIVDHRLRGESAREAELTAARARSLGADTEILVWQDPSPGQAAARMARHRLLACRMRELGAETLFLGHTANDVIETLQMRLARVNAGWRALAVMPETSPSPAWPDGRGLTLARPFVRTSRLSLRAYLQARGTSWIDDPSNSNAAFERVRVRRTAPDPLSSAGARLLRLNDAALQLDARIRQASAHLIAQAAEMFDWGGVRLDPLPLVSAPRELLLRALEALVLAVSGRSTLPDPSHLVRLADALFAGTACTASGVLLTRNGVLGRDPGAAAGRADGLPGAQTLHLLPGECGVFDGRFQVCAGAVALEAGAPEGRGANPSSVPAPLRPALVEVRSAGSACIAGLDDLPGGGAAGALIAERLDDILRVSVFGTGR